MEGLGPVALGFRWRLDVSILLLTVLLLVSALLKAFFVLFRRLSDPVGVKHLMSSSTAFSEQASTADVCRRVAPRPQLLKPFSG